MGFDPAYRTGCKIAVIDETGKANGRGAYLKKDTEVIKKAQTTKALERILEVTISDSIYEEMLSLVD